MIRFRDTLAPLLGDARYLATMLAVVVLFATIGAGRIVVAVLQDVVGSARRMWE
jgi:hypothetical protein